MNYQQDAKKKKIARVAHFYEKLGKVLFSTVSILMIVFTLPTTITRANTSLHDGAVELARAGYYKDAIQILKPITSQEPDSRAVLEDLAVIYCWNKQFKEAVSIFEENLTVSSPEYVLTALADAYRFLDREMEAKTLEKKLQDRLLRVHNKQ